MWNVLGVLASAADQSWGPLLCHRILGPGSPCQVTDKNSLTRGHVKKCFKIVTGLGEVETQRAAGGGVIMGLSELQHTIPTGRMPVPLTDSDVGSLITYTPGWAWQCLTTCQTRGWCFQKKDPHGCWVPYKWKTWMFLSFKH